MEERIIDTLRRLMKQAKAAGQQPVQFAMSKDDWAEAVNDAAGDGVDLWGGPPAELPKQFMGIPIDLRDLKGNGKVEMTYKDGSSVDA